MKLIWHIVKKDLRNLRWLLAGWLAVIALQAALGIWALSGSEGLFQAHDAVNAANRILIGLQLVMAVFLTAEIVQEDSLVDPKAHWLTLPIAGPHLLAAKLTGFVLIVWLLPAAVWWPWWLVNHWGLAELAMGTLAVVVLHALITLPALLVATMTSNWTRFLTWMLVFIMALVVAGVSLMTQYASIPIEIRPPETLPWSRAIVGLGAIVVLAAFVTANQYLTRFRPRSIVAISIASLAVALTLNFWPTDFAASVMAAFNPEPPPPASIQLHLGSISGSAHPTDFSNGFSTVGLNVEGTIGGLAPEDRVFGQLLGLEWRWGNASFRKSKFRSFDIFSSVSRDPGPPPLRSSELFPPQDALYSLGLPVVPTYAAQRMLAEPSQFKARMEMAVIHREILAEVPPRVGVSFGQGSERVEIVAAERREGDLLLTIVQTFPVLRALDFQRAPFWTFRSFVFFNRSDREMVKTIGRTSTQSSSDQRLDFIGGVFVSRTVYRILAPREFFPDQPEGKRYGPVDSRWFDEISVIWTQSRPIARFETEIVEPHFVVRNELPNRTPYLRR